MIKKKINRSVKPAVNKNKIIKSPQCVIIDEEDSEDNCDENEEDDDDDDFVPVAKPALLDKEADDNEVDQDALPTIDLFIKKFPNNVQNEF